MKSPFAIGASKLTWADDDIRCSSLFRQCTMKHFTSCLCSKLGASRVGNMVVLREAKDDTGRPRLLCVLGPFWPVLICVTLPAFVLLHIWMAFTILRKQHVAVVVIWAVVGVTMFVSLCCVSCRDPGILYRHREKPCEDWVWNDQAFTFRPAGAKYDSECGVIVENYDHTCPWTGTVRIFLVQLQH